MLRVVNLLTAEHKKMRAVSALALVLVIFGAFIHRSCAIKCYECKSEDGKFCDKLDKDHSGVNEKVCPAGYNACGLGRGTAKRKNISCTFCIILVGFLFL